MYAKTIPGLVAVVLCAGLGAAMPAEEPVIQGEYLEARTCDVWTGPCFSNSEINLRGKNAVVGWAVAKGSWSGAALDGLKVVAVIDSEGTLGTDFEGAVQAALYVDEAASPVQARALVDLARSLAPRHLSRIVAVERRAIPYARKGLAAEISAGPDVLLRTTPLCPCDAICCNEEQAYPAVSGSTRVECVKTAEHAYRGDAFGGVRWSDPNRRSAMVGTFAR